MIHHDHGVPIAVVCVTVHLQVVHAKFGVSSDGIFNIWDVNDFVSYIIPRNSLPSFQSSERCGFVMV